MPLQTTAPAKTATNTEPIKKNQSNTCTRRSESTLRDATKEMKRPTVPRCIPDQRCMCNRQIYSRPLKSIHHGAKDQSKRNKFQENKYQLKSCVALITSHYHSRC